MTIEWVGEKIKTIQVADDWAAYRGLRRVESEEFIRLWVTTKMSLWLQSYLDPNNPGRWWDSKPCARVQEIESQLWLAHWWWIPKIGEP